MRTDALFLACSLICGGCACVATPSTAAQTVSVSKTRIPENPEDVALQKKLEAAQDAASHNDYQTAIQDFQDYLAQKPNDAGAHFGLGYAYSALEQRAKAQAEYERAIALDPKMQPAYQNLGLTLLRTDPAAAIEPLQKAVELAPDEPQPKFLLGDALERTGKLPDAIGQYRAAEKLDDKNFDVHFSLGRILLRGGDGAGAEAEFRSAIALRPKAAEAHLGLAQSLLREKKTSAAAGEMNSYLQDQPADSEARLDYASLLEQTGKYDEALAQLDQAAKQRPEDLKSLRLRAQILYDQKQYAAAIPILQKAATLAPQDADIPAELGHLYIEQKDYPNAARALADALKITPAANDVLGELVTAEYLGKDYAHAVENLDVLAKREPLSAGTWFIRGDCYDKLGQKQEALDAYGKFLQLNTNLNSDFYFEAAARVRILKRELEKKR